MKNGLKPRESAHGRLSAIALSAALSLLVIGCGGGSTEQDAGLEAAPAATVVASAAESPTPGDDSPETGATPDAPAEPTTAPATPTAVVAPSPTAVTPAATSTPLPEPESDEGLVVIDIVFQDGDVSVADDRVAVTLGSMVIMNATSDVAEEIHVHGYNKFLDLVPGETTTLRFTADAPGIFEAELEGSGRFVVELEVAS